MIHVIKGNISLCDFIPEKIPFQDQNFDLIYAFSVFTHLSEKTHKKILEVIEKRLNDDGFLILTIRPRSIWNIIKISEEKKHYYYKLHDSYGYAFHPQGKEMVDGEKIYGDTSISLKYIQNNWKNWKLIDCDFPIGDSYQLICFFKKRE